MTEALRSRRHVQFRVLGPLEVDAGDGPVPLGGPKQRAVLARLLIHANQVVTADSLIGEIWGEEPPEKARHTLQTYVSNLRRALGEDRLVGRTPGYVLVLDPVDLDAARFDTLVRDAKKALPVDPNVAIATLDDALGLWRGPALADLADLADRSSLHAEATRLDGLRLEAQEDRIDGLLAAGLPARAIGELETLVAAHPLREGLWNRLMLALYRDERQADALAAFQRAREVLADELGIDPSPELSRLHERILKQDSGLELRGEPLRGYRLLERMDEGPNGAVYRAIQPHVGRDVAIKLFHEHIAIDPAFVRRFDADAQSVAALEHPHIAPVYDYWREPGRAYLVTRYLRGGSLRGFEERAGSLSPDRALRAVEQIASALAFAHRHGVAHGSVRPSNVLFDADSNAYLADFRVGVGPDPTSAEDVRALAGLAAHLLGADLPPYLAELIDRVDTESLDADTFADAARTALEPAAGRRRSGQDVRNPFKGLRAFSAADARDFFGRAELTERLLSRLNEPGRDSRFLALVGPSGSGKSSVVRAGLVPALRRTSSDAKERFVAELYPGIHPLEELAAALLAIAVRPIPRLEQTLEQGSRGLLEALGLVTPDGSEVVLVVDQFEELFTLTTSEHEREAFLEALRVATADPRSRCRIIVTLRADFYDRPLVYPRFGELLATRTEGVPPLTPDELEQAIRRPAEQEGIRLEPGLVAEVIADVAHQPGALPLLQYALTDLFEDRDGEWMTLDAYRGMGGIAGALSAQAERTYIRSDKARRRAIREVLLRLVALGEGREDTRRRVTIRELDDLGLDEAAVTSVLDAFGRHRLLTSDREPATREPTVEIAHEALLGAWGRLHAWIDEAREDLRTERRLSRAAAEWRGALEDASFLLRGARLEQSEAWASTTALTIGRDLRRYLTVSIEQRDGEQAKERERRELEGSTERRSRARLRGLVAVFAAAALVAGVLTIVATNESSKAAGEARVATARELAAAAVANLRSDPERSILLAMAAIDQTRSVDGTVLPEAEEALHEAVTTSRVEMTTPGIGGEVAWSPDGVIVAEHPGESGVIDIRDATTGSSVIAPFQGHDGRLTGVEFSADGSVLATTGSDGALRMWDSETGNLVTSVVGPGTARDPSFGGDGALVSAVWNTSITRIVDLATGAVVQTFRMPFGPLPPEEIPVADAMLSSDGTRVALAGSVGTVVMDAASGDEVVGLRGPRLVYALAWSPDDRSIATVGASGVIQVWNARTGHIQHELWGQKSFLWAVDWNPDGSRIVTGGDEGAVQIWEVGENQAEELMSLPSPEMSSGIGGVAFSPDGRRVIAGAVDRSAAKVWDVGPTGDAEWANLPAPRSFGDAAFMPDGNHVAVSNGRASATIWELSPPRKVQTIGIPGGARSHPTLAVSPDGHSVVISSESFRGVTAYDTRSAELLFATDRRVGPDPVWNPDGTLVALGGAGGSLRILDRSGRTVTLLAERAGDPAIASALFSPDGQFIATTTRVRGDAEEDGLLLIWDWRQGQVAQEFDAGRGAMAFDRTGAHLVTFDGEAVETWDLRTGARVSRNLMGPVASHWAVQFSPDGSRIAISLRDGTIELLDATSGEQLMTLRGHLAGASALSFSPDGDKLASVGFGLGGDTVRVWALDLDDLLEIARDNVTRSLTDDECRQFLHVDHC